MPARTPRLSAASAAWGLAFVAGGCASARLPPPEVLARARAEETYTATLRFGISGPGVRGRGRALVAFSRPDKLRLEVPGPAGARLVAVAQEGTMEAVFPGDRAVFKSPADSRTFSALFGLELTPSEMMDLLVGTPPRSLRSYHVRWGSVLPSEVDAELADGTRLRVTVESAEGGAAIPAAAFGEPPHESFRSVTAEEARSLWSPR